jgi:hypothetical protein
MINIKVQVVLVRCRGVIQKKIRVPSCGTRPEGEVLEMDLGGSLRRIYFGVVVFFCAIAANSYVRLDVIN